MKKIIDCVITLNEKIDVEKLLYVWYNMYYKSNDLTDKNG